MRTPVALVGDPHVELSPQQRLALAVLHRALADLKPYDREDWRRLLEEDASIGLGWFRGSNCAAWCVLAGIDVNHFRRYVLRTNTRKCYFQWMTELLDAECLIE